MMSAKLNETTIWTKKSEVSGVGAIAFVLISHLINLFDKSTKVNQKVHNQD